MKSLLKRFQKWVAGNEWHFPPAEMKDTTTLANERFKTCAPKKENVFLDEWDTYLAFIYAGAKPPAAIEDDVTNAFLFAYMAGLDAGATLAITGASDELMRLRTQLRIEMLSILKQHQKMKAATQEK